jgi:hypothetical protein
MAAPNFAARLGNVAPIPSRPLTAKARVLRTPIIADTWAAVLACLLSDEDGDRTTQRDTGFVTFRRDEPNKGRVVVEVDSYEEAPYSVSVLNDLHMLHPGVLWEAAGRGQVNALIPGKLIPVLMAEAADLKGEGQP